MDHSNPQRKSRRKLERTLLDLPVHVHCRENDYEWDETSIILDATPFGARFRITRPLGPGRLVLLEMDMPRHLRCFDHDEPMYCTWALVRHIRQLEPRQPGGKQFEIGVALIGRQPPNTAEMDPTAEYSITSGPTDESLWGVSELNTPAEVEQTIQRRDPRLPIITDVIIEVYDALGKVSASEQVKTENISRRGMAVTSELNLIRGRYVRLRSSEFNIAVIAAVRRIRRGADGKKRLHLEFVDQQWPALEES